MRYLSMKKQKRRTSMFAFAYGGVVSDDGLEPPTYAV
jgi:hypothetical protein